MVGFSNNAARFEQSMRDSMRFGQDLGANRSKGTYPGIELRHDPSAADINGSAHRPTETDALQATVLPPHVYND